MCSCHNTEIGIESFLELARHNTFFVQLSVLRDISISPLFRYNLSPYILISFGTTNGCPPLGNADTFV